MYAEGKVSWYKAENSLTDLPSHLFVLRNGYRPAKKFENATVFRPSLKDDAPASIDWRDYGYVTDVKDQGECGSCWAFASTGAIEGQYKGATGNLVSLSEQNLIDCSDQNSGCEGGVIAYGLDYVSENGGIDTEDSYGYDGANGQCRFNSDNIGATVSGGAYIPEGDEGALEAAVGTQGPVAVAIDSSNIGNYGGGIFYDDDCLPTDLHHVMLVVGYGRESDQDYWIVKNSWGSGWGESGLYPHGTQTKQPMRHCDCCSFSSNLIYD